ncbi:hypothetical protein BCR43DRAFT_358994 [Syncephalastrum racemosum]|uniref:Mso1 N-terminal domain-containing protein n=1 Tax=Syncephalastrum racemosum TaxID=13706 RepID=A0A1X2H6V0_SYNRA|nr:hypothetical protein BCR43DRAFT_358994 [Syncephalastrum racemosum]
MGTRAVDYRVSKIIVLCKDCNQDVGLYPARHKCEQVVRPPLPPLPTSLSIDKDYSPPPNLSRSTSSSSSSFLSRSGTTRSNDGSSTRGWGRRLATRTNSSGSSSIDTPVDEEDDNIYFNKFAANLEPESTTSSATGKSLWGKVRGNDKLKQLSSTQAAAEKSKSGRLWGKLFEATQNMTLRDDPGPESDDSDWEGETHVSRVLREYHEKKGGPLPGWLLDERTPSHVQGADEALARRSSRRKQRLWQVEEQRTQREMERDVLRRMPSGRRSPPPPQQHHQQHHYRHDNEDHDDVQGIYDGYYAEVYSPPTVARTRSERVPRWQPPKEAISRGYTTVRRTEEARTGRSRYREGGYF